MTSKTSKLDENLYSRQLLTFDKVTMQKMINSTVIISGMSGLGLEVAKNVILAGAKKVVIHDQENLVTALDLASGYYLGVDDIGGKKLCKLLPNLKSLNSNVEVEAISGILSEDALLEFNVGVFCDYNMYDLFGYNKKMRENGSKFIMVNSHGLYGYVFCDFGDEFEVRDLTGEKIKSGVLVEVGDGNYRDKVVPNTITSNEPHNLEMGDVIKLRVMGEVLDKTFKITKLVDRTSFTLDKCPFEYGELVKTEFEQVKVPKTMEFKDLESSIEEPDILMTDIINFEIPYTLHNFTKAMWMMYSDKHFKDDDLTVPRFNDFPKSWNEDDAQILFKLCKGMDKDVNEDTIRKLSYTCAGKLCPMDSIVGSLAAQEVMKAFSGKYTPTKQWMYLHSLSAFPDVELPFTGDVSNYQPIGKYRYDGQIMVFGKELVKKIRKGKIFVVGSGAIGCEHLKNFSMMGVGNIVVTDMDHIETSNLNRQFLFRPDDVGNPKSVTAAAKAKAMNPDVTFEAHENKVGEETLNVYNKEFFSSLTAVANALDNVQAREFMDSLCVEYQKFLLESGTLGTKCNVQIVVPHGSECYSDSSDPPEQGIPVCTLKNFPYLFEHVVQYARDMMEGLFTNAPNDYIKASKNLGELKKMTRTDLVTLYRNVKLITENKIRKYKDCLRMAFRKWHEEFRDQINNLVHKFPESAKKDDGSPFWSGSKRFPQFQEFDVYNEDHIGFVMHMAHILADMYGIEERVSTDDTRKHRAILRGFKVPELVTRDIHVKTEEDKKRDDEDDEDDESDGEEEKKDGPSDDTDTMDKSELVRALTSALKKPLPITAIEFEKDDDSNHHIDFITATANMRAYNYHIETKDRLQVKGIAGKIIPAIATTTALVSGLVSMELYKVFQDKVKTEDYRDSFCNTALTIFSQSEPKEVKTDRINGKDYNIWKYENVKGSDTVSSILEKFIDAKLEHKIFGTIPLEINYIAYGDQMIYGMSGDESDLKKTIKQLLEEHLEDHEAPYGDVECIHLALDPEDPDDSDDSEDESDSDSDDSEDDTKGWYDKMSDQNKELFEDYEVQPIMIKVDMTS